MLGISIKPSIGIGDTVQFSSVPENYYKTTGERLMDVGHSWIFDHNPYVVRDKGTLPSRVVEMWNFSPRKYDWPVPKNRTVPVYYSNAEIHAAVFGVPAVLTRPRLYKHEDFPFEKREKILLHTDGRSHGKLPPHVIQHIIEKYKPTGQLFLIGKSEVDYGLPRIHTETIWDLVKVISEARMLLGSDSGPSWLAACFPDVVIKKVRLRPSPENFQTWTPLEISNCHSHWDDRCFQIFNPSETDTGAFQSYRRL